MHLPAPIDHVAPHWSADELASAMPRTLPPLHCFEFRLPANAAELHRPRRRLAPYAATTGLSPFRVRG